MSEQLTWEEAVAQLLAQEGERELAEACYFDSPVEACAERFYRSEEWAQTRRYLPAVSEGARALDIGAGRGIASYALAKEGWSVSALEPDESGLVGAGAIRELLRHEALDISVVVAEGERLPFEDATFDLVYLRQVLHHAKDLGRLCGEIGRVLKKGGMLVAVREHVIDRHADRERFFEKHPLHRLYGGENAYLLREYIDAIEGGGIRLDVVLPPYSNPVNLAPWNPEKIRRKLYEKSRLHWPMWSVGFLLRMLDRFSKQPGRLYSFIGHKT